MLPICGVGTANAHLISAVGAEHGRDCRSRCLLRDAACPNLVRIAAKEKGRQTCAGAAPSTGSLVWGRAGCLKLSPSKGGASDLLTQLQLGQLT